MKKQRGGIRKPGPIMQVGAIVIRRSRYPNGKPVKFIKVKMGGPLSRQWMAYARWWWLQNRGPIPEGYCVAHKNGDLMDDSPDNLFLATGDDRNFLAQQRMSEAERERMFRRCHAASVKANKERALARIALAPLPSAWHLADHSARTLTGPYDRRGHAYAALGLSVPPGTTRDISLRWTSALLGWPHLSAREALLLAACAASPGPTGDVVSRAQDLAERLGFRRPHWCVEAVCNAFGALLAAGLVSNRHPGTRSQWIRSATDLAHASRGTVYDVACVLGRDAGRYIDEGYEYRPILPGKE